MDELRSSWRVRAAVAVVLAVVTAGCSSSRPRSVMDITWGDGWNSPGSQVYGEAMPMQMQKMKTGYYQEQVRTVDAEGRPVAPLEQVKFMRDVLSNAETGKEADPAAFWDRAGNRVRLSDYKGTRNVILVFTRGFPGYICPLCTSYTAQITHRYAEISAAGAEVLLVFPGSPDRVDEFVRACREIVDLEGDGALPFPVLLDAGLENVELFGIEGDLARPSTYVIDREGTVRYAFVGEQPHERPDVETILRELARLGGGAK